MLAAHPVGALHQVFNQDPMRLLGVPRGIGIIDLGDLPTCKRPVVCVKAGVH